MRVKSLSACIGVHRCLSAAKIISGWAGAGPHTKVWPPIRADEHGFDFLTGQSISQAWRTWTERARSFSSRIYMAASAFVFSLGSTLTVYRTISVSTKRILVVDPTPA